MNRNTQYNHSSHFNNQSNLSSYNSPVNSQYNHFNRPNINSNNSNISSLHNSHRATENGVNHNHKSRGVSSRKKDRHTKRRIAVGFTKDESKVLEELKSNYGARSLSKLIRILILSPEHHLNVKQFDLEMEILSQMDNHLHDIDMILSTDYFNNYNLLSSFSPLHSSGRSNFSNSDANHSTQNLTLNNYNLTSNHLTNSNSDSTQNKIRNDENNPSHHSTENGNSNYENQIDENSNYKMENQIQDNDENENQKNEVGDEKIRNGKSDDDKSGNSDSNLKFHSHHSTPINFISSSNSNHHSTGNNSIRNRKHHIRNYKQETVKYKIIKLIKEMNHHIEESSREIGKIDDKIDKLKSHRKRRIGQKGMR